MMKKGLAAVLGLLMVCSVAACGKKEEAETTQAATVAEETTAGASETAGEGETVGENVTVPAPEMPEYVSAFDLEDISEYVELGEYKGIEVTAMETEVTDEDVEEELKSQVEQATPVYEEITEGTVAEGDVAISISRERWTA